MADMDNKKEIVPPELADAVQEPPEADGSAEESAPERPTRGLEGFYENFRGVPLKYLDAFIIVCIVLLIAIIAFGVIKARA